MKNAIIIFTTFLLFFSFSVTNFAQNKFESKLESFKSTTPKKTLPNNIPLDKSILWEITGNGLKKPSYIFGTIHIICEEDYFWNSVFEKALDASDEIVFEIDYTHIVEYYEEQFEPEILNKYYFSKNNKIDYIETENPFSKLKDNIRTSPFQFQRKSDHSVKDRLKNNKSENSSNPHNKMLRKANNFLNTILYLQLQKPYFSEMSSSYDDCEKQFSYEIKITEKGLIKGKSFDYLESVEEQLDALNSTEDAYRTKDERRKALDDTTSYDTQIRKLVRLYTSQNIMALYDYMVNPSLGILDLDAVIFNRNIAWVDRIPGKLASGKSLFIAVGAGHLASEKGLIHLLRKEGYIVRPILSIN